MNKNISSRDIDKYINLSDRAKLLMKKLANTYTLSPRAYHRVLRISKTIADLEGIENINESHILEAFQYRPKGFEE